jgi:enoyl-CoA hydratase/carnithine racemase
MSAMPQPEVPVLLREDRDGVSTLTMNRPAQMNLLTLDMLGALQSAFDAIAQDGSVRVVVLAASGKGFCAGHDLKEIRGLGAPEKISALFETCNRMMLSIQQLPQPVIARVQGAAAAAGCQLVAQCDLAVASTDAKFAVSGVNLGLFCSTPSVPLLRNVPAKFAMEMLVTGDFISAQEAQERALVNRAVAPDRLDAEVQKLVDSILAKPRAAIAMGKELFYRQREMGLEAAYQLANQTMAVNMMDRCAQEGVTAFTEKRKPDWAK